MDGENREGWIREERQGEEPVCVRERAEQKSGECDLCLVCERKSPICAEEELKTEREREREREQKR